jgi:P27 family predicted phage terminase small subunit
MRGRKPKPTVLRELTGNAGKRPLNHNEPKPRAGIPSCPKHLDQEARKEWRRITKVLCAIGLLTHADRAGLAAYCQCYSRWVKLEGVVQQLGECLPEIAEGKPTGRMLPNPYLGALNRALLLMRSYLSEFGLTPASRTRLSIVPPPQENAFAAFLNRGQAGEDN